MKRTNYYYQTKNMKEHFSGNVIKGPWGEPKAKEGKKDIVEGGRLSLDVAQRVISQKTGLSEPFLSLCLGAANPRPSQPKIEEQKREISSWTLNELLAFANDESNHGVLSQKPALAIAIYELVAKR